MSPAIICAIVVACSMMDECYGSFQNSDIHVSSFRGVGLDNIIQTNRFLSSFARFQEAGL